MPGVPSEFRQKRRIVLAPNVGLIPVFQAWRENSPSAYPLPVFVLTLKIFRISVPLRLLYLMNIGRSPEHSNNRDKSAHYKTKIVKLFGLSFAQWLYRVSRDPDTAVRRIFLEQYDASF